MKKIALLFLTVLTLFNCGDEVEFSTPGFQAKKNYNIWRATYFNATIDNSSNNGAITISAGKDAEKLTIILNSGALGPHFLSETSSSEAIFTDINDEDYSTAYPADPSVSLYPEEGEVRINEYTPAYISGTFRFIAYTEDGLESVGFHEGEFYRIPLTGGSSQTGSISCAEATSNLGVAASNFTEVSQGDEEYPARCNAYKSALQDAIAACGDTSGAFQAMIDNLGDCTN